MGYQRFLLKPIGPFRLDLTIWELRRRKHNIIDRWDGKSFRRAVRIGDKVVSVTIRQAGSSLNPILLVDAEGESFGLSEKSIVKQLINKIMGTKIDLKEFYKISRRDKNLGLIVRKFIGAKPPRFESVFEAAVNAICCQQLSLDVGITLLNRLAGACAKSIKIDGERQYAFPLPKEIIKLKVDQIRQLGLSTNKAKAVYGLAQEICEKNLNLEGLADLSDEEAIGRLLEIRGIGRWTAEYILLRGMGRLHIFPGDDLGFQNGLKRIFNLTGNLDYWAVGEILSNWKPYGGLIYFHLLLEKLSRENFI